jgi:hypothetical protein
MHKQCATEIQQHALKAVSELSRLLQISQDQCSQEEYERIRMGVGLCIGRIQTNLLDVIYTKYPELDDLR